MADQMRQVILDPKGLGQPNPIEVEVDDTHPSENDSFIVRRSPNELPDCDSCDGVIGEICRANGHDKKSCFLWGL